MTKSLYVFTLLFCFFFWDKAAFTQPWEIAGDKIKSPWAETVQPSGVWNEYPRPQMKRNNWQNLNGLWDYAVFGLSTEQTLPLEMQGKILVPFAIESSLSGVGKTVGKDSILWYRHAFATPGLKKGERLLLHFGAVDWQSTVFINGSMVGIHQGGYDPFYFDITNALSRTGMQQLAVSVFDPTSDSSQPRGKQVVNPEGIWYTPVTGIWQTVWLEVVPETYIAAIQHTPNLDSKQISIKVSIENLQPGDKIKASAWKGKEQVAAIEGGDTNLVLTLPDVEAWSPANPFLYDVQLQVMRKGKVLDAVNSYVGMRKISIAPDENGIQRILLNNEFLFQYGPLDQGWWPDGLYTAPNDEALRYDISQTKKMGFNMIRKHVKVEPARWYYHCDTAGILVWQDMPSGDLGNRWENHPGIIGTATDKQRSIVSENNFKTEWENIIQSLYNFPSIITWVPFNEAWGQFKTAEIVQFTRRLDSSRLINSASGGNFEYVGDMIDLHNYPDPAMPDPAFFGKQQAIVLGEFGGLGLPLEGHTWQKDRNWGYQSFKNKEELFTRYASLIKKLENLIPLGLSAAVYTQTTDVEGEVNGFITYDRKILKMDLEKLQHIHSELYSIKP